MENVVMKPECRHAVERIAALSADDLSAAEADLVRRHLEECPPCKGQWLLFERTLLSLSTATQPLVDASRSKQMWLVCVEHAKAGHQGASQISDPPGANSPGARLMRQPLRDAASKDKIRDAGFTSGMAWLGTSSRLGWALAGGAAVALGAAYFLAPQVPPQAANLVAQVNLPPMPPDGPGNLIHFQRPPSNYASFFGHHAAISFEPYADHVGPDVASYSVSVPASRP